jgi:hypothetical protein
MKRLLLAILLALPMAGIANQTIDPIPDCIPCPPDQKPPVDNIQLPDLPPAN